VDYICNMATINYIMRGFFTPQDELNTSWANFASALGWSKTYTEIQDRFKFLQRLFIDPDSSDISYEDLQNINLKQCDTEAAELFRDHFRPIGVVISAEKQGGQHEGSNNPVTWPVSYVVTISVDGKNENLCNYWRHLNISSGSMLGFTTTRSNHSMYVLNHNKQLITKTFGATQITDRTYPQVIPAKTDNFQGSKHLGHWHFCMSQTMYQNHPGHKTSKENPLATHGNDITSYHSGALLQTTISIVYTSKSRQSRREFIVNSIWTKKKAGSSSNSSRRSSVSTRQFVASHIQPVYKGSAKQFTTTSQDVKRAYPGYMSASTNPRAQALLDRHKNTDTGVVRKHVTLTDAELIANGCTPRCKVQRIEAVKVTIPVITVNALAAAVEPVAAVEPTTSKRGKTASTKLKTDRTFPSMTEDAVTRL
jgi:hypothetical protein